MIYWQCLRMTSPFKIADPDDLSWSQRIVCIVLSVVVRGAGLEPCPLQNPNHRAPVGESGLQQIQSGKSGQRQPPR
jgi:hypothetical protein